MVSTEVIVAIVALIISLVALTATFMQVLQQYYASAAGYSQCNEKVMGGWARTKTRRFSWEELRYEVQYDSPVIFVSPPHNKRGPIPDAPIYFLDGTPKSFQDTWTTSELDPRKEYLNLSAKERIHTADNERASWSVLLYAIQRMEAKSREWQDRQYPPPGSLTAKYGLPRTPPSLREHHTLTVALQRKRKSWDTMPLSMTKPYATTTMCHMIEMLAALGVYWKEFDRRRDRYWAEGNGFLVLGERNDLGIVFSLQVHGQCTFERNRVIPVDYVKELTFGYVPTIYRDTIDQSRLKVPSDMPENLSSLQMGRDRELAESLTVIGCSTNAVNYFLEDGNRTSHIFPLAFEILGMLGQNFHISNSSFTYIPNPTPYSFDKRSFSLRKLLEAFKSHFDGDVETTRNQEIVDVLRCHVDDVLKHYWERDGPQRLICLRVLHTAIDDTDEILTGKRKDSVETGNNDPAAAGAAAGSAAIPVVICSEDPSETTGETTHQSRRREAVQDVLRSHIQEVLRLLNERDDRVETQSLHVNLADRTPTSPLQPRALHERIFGLRPTPPPRFEDVDDASPDERQQLLMDVYFEVVRLRVVPKAAFSTGRRASLVGFQRPQSLPSMRGGARSISRGPSLAPRPGSSRGGSSAGDGPAADHPLALFTGPSADEEHAGAADASAVTGDADDGDADEHDADEHNSYDHSADDENGVAVDATTDRRGRSHVSLAKQLASHDDIWCTLVFRMICWLMLHDFNKLDVQLPKSELLGSRVPVYIA
ncbi:hypothetical protein ISF_02695 [Cordyceps fumosorosea ARSEF 2679]|uniref:Modin n=1 Tax=Cordyceps fumosorosea (strain ARSEF 2679) TaxID=1081104 RepID=A0A168BYU6_CORFA|nr:hypothetical protein ISF_02695 [Cordyceps fumosorosea ARSEF 2679]OAA70721.1 hypothetical protein ISF_02695 [Cordyceps fumosorosea ARSEF 2679]